MGSSSFCACEKGVRIDFLFAALSTGTNRTAALCHQNRISSILGSKSISYATMRHCLSKRGRRDAINGR